MIVSEGISFEHMKVVLSGVVATFFLFLLHKKISLCWGRTLNPHKHRINWYLFNSHASFFHGLKSLYNEFYFLDILSLSMLFFIPILLYGWIWDGVRFVSNLSTDASVLLVFYSMGLTFLFLFYDFTLAFFLLLRRHYRLVRRMLSFMSVQFVVWVLFVLSLQWSQHDRDGNKIIFITYLITAIVMSVIFLWMRSERLIMSLYDEGLSRQRDENNFYGLLSYGEYAVFICSCFLISRLYIPLLFDNQFRWHELLSQGAFDSSYFVIWGATLCLVVLFYGFRLVFYNVRFEYFQKYLLKIIVPFVIFLILLLPALSLLDYSALSFLRGGGV